MKRLSTLLALVLLTGTVFAEKVTTTYQTATGQLTLKASAGGSAVFRTGGVDYDVWLPWTREVSTIASGSTVAIEGVYVTKAAALEAPVVHPYKLTYRGRTIDVSTAFGWAGSGQTRSAAGYGVDTLSAASSAPGRGDRFGGRSRGHDGDWD